MTRRDYKILAAAAHFAFPEGSPERSPKRDQWKRQTETLITQLKSHYTNFDEEKFRKAVRL